MQMTGERRIEAPRERVWQALNDPDILLRSIPGCEELEKTAEDAFTAKVKAKVGPVSAKFAGTVTLSDLDPPRSYKISGEGKGGAAGFAKGGAEVQLEEDGGATLLKYQVDAKVGGKLAQIGSRLIDGTANKMAGEFFDSFAEAVTAGAAPGAEAAPEPEAALTGALREELETAVKPGLSPRVWMALLVAAILVLLAIFAI